MQQYARIKGEHPDALLLFRVGDFYETFGSDAVTASRVLGITLTRRNNGGSQDTELAGFPYHALDTYLPKLVRAGLRVAICDQLEDPKLAKTVVERGVTEVVTPGVTFSEHVVDQRGNHWLAALSGGPERFGLALLDITTGEFLVAEEDASRIARLLEGHGPKEVLVPRGTGPDGPSVLERRFPCHVLDDWAFTVDFAREKLLRHFGTASLKGFGIDELGWGQAAAGAVLHYLGETRHDKLAHITRIRRLHPGDHLGTDRFTVRNLELVEPIAPGGATLLASLDHCTTPMGSRLLRRWLLFPLVDAAAIEERLDRVEALLHFDRDEELGSELSRVGDLERLVGRAAAARINPRELLQLADGVMAAAALRELLSNGQGALSDMAAQLDPPLALAERIIATIDPAAPADVRKGGVVRTGVDPDLDDARHVASHTRELLLQLQQREIERTGITSLKVGYNNVFGYYLEVRHTHREKVPPEWVRKQTLTGAERYLTPELKELEERVLGAEERGLALEQELFQRVVTEVVEGIAPLQATAQALAHIDVLRNHAYNARRWRYNRPILDNGRRLEIVDGRHPVIEQRLPAGESYVANDLLLDPDDRQMLMITGPNMSGKSALLRQTALIVIMAQSGSFVPARSVRLGVVDRVFTRVGASDNLSTGESTFMVEMNETASILNNLSERSLVLLDEIGRGTSTYDGISIAWAIAEYLHAHAARPKTLFATHYHELNEMAATHPRIHNASVAVREMDGRVLFLRKLVPGGSDRSFGIHVARMAGMPDRVLERAKAVLNHLERSHAGDLGADGDRGTPLPATRQAPTGIGSAMQLSFFQLDDPALEGIREELMSTDIDTLTPVEALLKLHGIKKRLGPGQASLASARLRKA